MKTTFVLIAILRIASVLAAGQTRPEFEVASIKPSGDVALGTAAVGLHIDGAQIRVSYFSLRDYIAMAYRTKVQQISGPDWVASTRFDISAKLPEGTNRGQVPEMLQALLEDRFGLKLHRDSKEFPVYVLEVARTGLKMKEVDSDAGNGSVNIAAAGSGAGVSVNLGNGSYYIFADNRFEGKKLTMTALADNLTRFMDRTVVDQTGLKASYDLALDISPEDYRAMLIRSALSAGVVLPPQALRVLDEASGDSLSSALQKMGLTLTARKAPLDILVIDSMQKTPSNN